MSRIFSRPIVSYRRSAASRTAIGGGHIVSPPPGALTCITHSSVDVVIGIAVVVIAVVSCNDIVNVVVADVGIVDGTVIVVVIVICSVIVVVVVVV